MMLNILSLFTIWLFFFWSATWVFGKLGVIFPLLTCSIFLKCIWEVMSLSRSIIHYHRADERFSDINHVESKAQGLAPSCSKSVSSSFSSGTCLSEPISLLHPRTIKNTPSGTFPGGPVVKSLRFHHRRADLVPGWGVEITHAAVWPK